VLSNQLRAECPMETNQLDQQFIAHRCIDLFSRRYSFLSNPRIQIVRKKLGAAQINPSAHNMRIRYSGMLLGRNEAD